MTLNSLPTAITRVNLIATLGAFGVLGSILSGCGTSPSEDGAPVRLPRAHEMRDAVPRSELPSRRGNPRSYVVFGKRYHTLESSHGYRAHGIASWYGTKFHGRSTSSGEPYDMYAMTAAHKTLPIPSYVRVTNRRNGQSAVVRVNDRGPFHGGRIIDLSYSAATKLGLVGHGTAPVEVEALPPFQVMRGTVPAKRPVARRNPEPPPVPPAAVSAPQSPTEHAERYVQVGAFDDSTNAERLRTRISSILGARVRIHAVTGTKTIYRVRVGPVRDEADAQRIEDQLMANGITERLVVLQ